jgi:hypothetical protein
MSVLYRWKIIIYLTANAFLPGGIGNTISHNTQNNPPRSNKAQHTKLHNNKQKYTTVKVTYYAQWIPLQYIYSYTYSYNTNTISNTIPI